jgi:hypothetical protein
LEDSYLASAFTPASLSSDNAKGFATAMLLYLTDVNQLEPAMVSLYEKVLPEVKRALSGAARYAGGPFARGYPAESGSGGALIAETPNRLCASRNLSLKLVRK